MKKFIAIVALFAMILAFSTACAEIYPQTFFVNDIDRAQDVLILIDFNGNEWLWSGIEDYEKGDIIAAIMEDNGTKIIYDDIIINIRYSGYIENWE